MPLTRGAAVGYDAVRMSYKFTMLDGTRTVHCEISSAALTDIAGGRWQKISLDRDAQFLAFRDTIEHIASSQFDARQAGPVRIFAKHLPRNIVGPQGKAK
jgi:Protein of unknown function (DUF1488)